MASIPPSPHADADPEDDDDQEKDDGTPQTAVSNSKKKNKKKKKKAATVVAEPIPAQEPSKPKPAPTEPIAKPQEGAIDSATALALIERRLKQIEANLPADKKPHPFWDHQPVPKFGETIPKEGPLEADRTEIRQQPYNLPQGFIWSDIDLGNPEHLHDLYDLLTNHYVEDSDCKFRFDYSKEFLKWSLQPPGFLKQWHCGVRYEKNSKLYGFISAVPAKIRAKGNLIQMVEINYLCAHKKVRSKRLAPVLIQEITRRVNLQGIFQATYTSGTFLPRPVTQCKYFHRSLNPKKLVECGFSGAGKTPMGKLISQYALPAAPTLAGVRPFESRDAPRLAELLSTYLEKFAFAPVFDHEDILHYFTHRQDILSCYVVENPTTHQIDAFTSFYSLPSSILGCEKHTRLNAAYSFYHASSPAADISMETLIYNALILAKSASFDVFNALALMDNEQVFEPLKFASGDGLLHYYLYNYALHDFPGRLNALVLF